MKTRRSAFAYLEIAAAALAMLLLTQIVLYFNPGLLSRLNPMKWSWPVIWSVEIVVIVGLVMARMYFR